jgi:glycosyltransferase involved in cell wall biosynthesis
LHLVKRAADLATLSNDPLVSIGLPVYNGSNYIKFALDSLLGQTYSNFEIIISDNGSTDETQQICQEYAARDSRIHYYRNEKTTEAPVNFNKVFNLSSGKYFKWAADDDIQAPEYLKKCIEILESDNSIVLCHSKTIRINENGENSGTYNDGLLKNIEAKAPHERFGDLIGMLYNACPLLGVGRKSIFQESQLLGGYIGADRNLLAEIGLMGKIHIIPEYMFFFRDHSGSYTSTFYGKNATATMSRLREQMNWWSMRGWTGFPHWKNCIEYFRSVNRVNMPIYEKLFCYDQISKWILKEGWKFLGFDVEIFLKCRSKFARKLLPVAFLNFRRTIFRLIGYFDINN